MPKQKRNLNVIFTSLALALFVLGIGGTYFYFLPQLRAANEEKVTAQAKSDGLNIDITTLQNAKADLDQARNSLLTKGVDLNHLNLIFPATEDVPGLYIQMEYLMNSTPGVSNGTYQISAPTADTVSGIRIPIAISAAGSYASLKGFIQSLQTNIRPVTILTMSFAQALDKDKNGKPIPDSVGKLTVNISGFVRAGALSPAYTQSTGK